LHVGECKFKVYPRFSILFNSSLGQAKLESPKNHELARGYLCGVKLKTIIALLI